MQPDNSLIDLAKRFHELGNLKDNILHHHYNIGTWVINPDNNKAAVLTDEMMCRAAYKHKLVYLLTESELWAWLKRRRLQLSPSVDGSQWELLGVDSGEYCMVKGIITADDLHHALYTAAISVA